MDQETIMASWDKWRAAIANGCAASWPRDEFEALLEYLEEQKIESVAKEHAACLSAVEGVMVTDHSINTWKRCVTAIKERSKTGAPETKEK